MRSVELSARDISCNHCKITIENGIIGIAGVNSVEVDIEAKRVTVVFDEYRAKTDTVLAEMAELGYPAEVIAG
ncbi:MAG: heavy-metal-associated domain-containing protein [Ferrimicrobium sp.]|uniref:heavy-metal-associated domain-containing protein n=1 Tax=Ferrimicrobium acidiphilum TaxID=121039 RepID=UPI0023F03665|nr:heavy-metal-associated domain-containing protein [Ferrimicrobium acidiphilum]